MNRSTNSHGGTPKPSPARHKFSGGEVYGRTGGRAEQSTADERADGVFHGLRRGQSSLHAGRVDAEVGTPRLATCTGCGLQSTAKPCLPARGPLYQGQKGSKFPAPPSLCSCCKKTFFGRQSLFGPVVHTHTFGHHQLFFVSVDAVDDAGVPVGYREVLDPRAPTVRDGPDPPPRSVYISLRLRSPPTAQDTG